MLNPENEFIKEQVTLLKQQYQEELASTKQFQVDEDHNYLKDFQDFDKPPVVPEGVAQTEFYRPNPAAFQKRINENPYAVDVGFSALQNPIYTKMDDFPARMNPRANSQFYNPNEYINHKVDYLAPQKPFVHNMNLKIHERGSDQSKLDELFLRSQQNQPGLELDSRQKTAHQFFDSTGRLLKHSGQPTNYAMYDPLRDAEDVTTT